MHKLPDENDMPGSKERIYGDQIAPALHELAKQSQDRGLSFVASAAWSPGESGSTVSLQAGSGQATRIAAAATRSSNNADEIIFAMMKYARQNGHSLIYLRQLGVPLSPQNGTPETKQ